MSAQRALCICILWAVEEHAQHGCPQGLGWTDRSGVLKGGMFRPGGVSVWVF